MHNVKRKVKKLYEALHQPEKKRLGRTKKAIQKIFEAIPKFQNPVAKEILLKELDEANLPIHSVNIAQWCLFNIYFGYEEKVNPTSTFFLEVVKVFTDCYKSTPSSMVKGVFLGALMNLGPFALRYWQNSHTPDPLMMALSSKNNFLKKCAQEAYDNLKVEDRDQESGQLFGVSDIQSGGKPMLTKKELSTVRKMGHDVPAYQESVHYNLHEDGDKYIPNAGQKVNGQIVDSKVVGHDEDGATITKQTILIPGQKNK